MKKKVNFFFFYLITLFLMFLLVSIYSYGQDHQAFRSELEQIARQTRWRIGPFRLFPTIRLRNTGYDDNVYYKRDEDNPVSDYMAIISPQVKVCFLFRNYLIISLTENLEYVYYFEQKRERRWNNIMSPEFKFLFLNRFVISGHYSYRNRKWRATSEFDVQANEIRKNHRGSLFYETARQTYFGISASLEKISYEDITTLGEETYLSRDLNREERSGNLEFYYKMFFTGSFFLKAGYTEYKFEHIQSRWRDSYSYQAYSGIRFPPGRKINGTLSFGYKKFLPRRGEKKGFSGLISNTRLSFRISRFIIRFQYNRDCVVSKWTNSIYFLEDMYGSGMSFYLTNFLRLNYNFSYRKVNYPELAPIEVPDGRYEEIKRKDIYRIHKVGFVLRIIRNVGIGVTVNFWERESNYYWANRDNMFIGGNVTYEF